jgi:hypothetical protein
MADKERLCVEQRIKTAFFFMEIRNVMVTQRQFNDHFHMCWAPSLKTIPKLYNQFNNDGSVLERKYCRLSSVCFPENTDTVRVALERSPSISIRKAAVQLGITR